MYAFLDSLKVKPWPHPNQIPGTPYPDHLEDLFSSYDTYQNLYNFESIDNHDVSASVFNINTLMKHISVFGPFISYMQG